MLPLGILGSAHKAAGGVTYYAPTAKAATGTDSATYTWDVGIGPESADRTVVVGVVASRSASRALNSVTIGGTAATIDVSRTAGSWYQSALARLTVPTGTTTTVQATYTNPMDRAFLFVWSIPFALSVFATGHGDNAAVSVNTTTGGLVLAAAMQTESSTPIDYSGATVRDTATTESRYGYALADATTGSAVTIAPSVTTGSTIAAVAYAPA